MNDSWDNQRVESGEWRDLIFVTNLWTDMAGVFISVWLQTECRYITLYSGQRCICHSIRAAAAASPGGRNYKNCHTPSWGQQLASSDGVKISSDDTRHLSTNISISDPVREEHNVSSSRTDNTQHQLAQRVLSPMGTVGSQLCRSSRETQIVRLIISWSRRNDVFFREI